MEKKLLSIIVPVYNKEKYIRKCIDSILAQDYENIEVLLVDDGSPDKSGEICDEYEKKDNRVRVFHRTNHGQNPSRKFGVDSSAGEYIGFVDADDYIEPNMYSRLIEVLEEEGADYVKCGFISITENGKEIGKSFYENYKLEGKDCFFGNESGWNVSACSAVYKKSLFYGVNFIHYSRGEDYVVALQVKTKCKKSIFLNEYYYNYLIVEGSMTNSGRSINNLDGVLSAEWGYNFYKEKYPEVNLNTAALNICHLIVYHISQLNKSDRNKYIRKFNEKYKFYFNKSKGIKKNNPKYDPKALLITKAYRISPFFAISIYKFVIWKNKLKSGGKNGKKTA